jgi:hypothetical protein
LAPAASATSGFLGAWCFATRDSTPAMLSAVTTVIPARSPPCHNSCLNANSIHQAVAAKNLRLIDASSKANAFDAQPRRVTYCNMQAPPVVGEGWAEDGARRRQRTGANGDEYSAHAWFVSQIRGRFLTRRRSQLRFDGWGRTARRSTKNTLACRPWSLGLRHSPVNETA